MKTALITGATSGIGKATAYLFAKNKINLVLCGRRLERLQKIKKELEAYVNVHILCFDVRKKVEVSEIFNNIPSSFKSINILVNNAGNAYGLSPLAEGNTHDWDLMLDINVKGLLYVSKMIIPQMIERKEGHIINIGSIAGKAVYPNGAVYCASKHAVDALNESMRIELYKYNIRVGAINPGLVETEFSQVRFKGDLDRAKKTYKGIDALQAEDIADIIHFVVSRPYYVNIADLLVLPTHQASMRDLLRREE